MFKKTSDDSVGGEHTDWLPAGRVEVTSARGTQTVRVRSLAAVQTLLLQTLDTKSYLTAGSKRT